MEDSSLPESEVENKGMSGRNEPDEMPIALSAGFSPSSEVHIVPFPASFFFFSPLSLVHLSSFLSFFHFCALALGPLLKCPPSPLLLPLSLIRQTTVNIPLFVSLSLSTPSTLSHSLFLSPSLSLSPSLIRYTDSSFQWTSFKRRLLP